MNFYELSAQLKISVASLFALYKKIFPEVKVLDYTVGLSKKEIELLKLQLMH